MNATPLKPQAGLIWLVWLVGFSCYAQAQTDLKAVEHLLASTIIPDVKFHDTPISDAIKTIENEFSRRSVDHCGFSVFLKLPGGAAYPVSSPPPTPRPEPRITLAMHNASVLEALRGVAAQAGLKVKIEQYAVAIIPLSESTEQLFTVELKVAPVFAPPADELSKRRSSNKRMDARAWLEASGVTFPPGASATYHPRTHKLVVRNTRANLDLVKYDFSNHY